GRSPVLPAHLPENLYAPNCPGTCIRDGTRAQPIRGCTCSCPSLLAALRALGDAPARSLTALAERLGVSEADVATVVVPLEEEPAPVAPIPAAVPASPLLPMTGPNGASSAPQTLLNRPRTIMGRNRT